MVIILKIRAIAVQITMQNNNVIIQKVIFRLVSYHPFCTSNQINKKYPQSGVVGEEREVMVWGGVLSTFIIFCRTVNQNLASH